MRTIMKTALLASLFLVGAGCDAMHSYVLRGQVVRADWRDRVKEANKAEFGSDSSDSEDASLDVAGVPSAEVSLEMNPFESDRTETRRATTDERGHFELRAHVFGGPFNPVKKLRLRVVREGFEPYEGTFDSGNFYFNSSGGDTLEALAGVRYILIPLQETSNYASLKRELESTIAGLDEVESAVVEFSPPLDARHILYEHEKDSGTAAVRVTLARGLDHLSDSTVSAIANAVSHAIPNLAAANVRISDGVRTYAVERPR